MARIKLREQCIGWFAEGPHCEEGHRLMLPGSKAEGRAEQ